MKKDKSTKSNVSRRNFIRKFGASSAGIMIAPALFSGIAKASPKNSSLVATATVSAYEEEHLRDAVEQSFSNIGGLGDIIKQGDKVGIKINLTGGSIHASDHQNSSGLHPGETYWTNPVLLKVVGEIIKDFGAGKLYIIEALTDWDSIYNFGYQDVIDYLGATFIDLNFPTPYSDYIEKSVGDDNFIYSDLTLNGIFNDLDCFISMPKAKQHATAGVTHGLKNLIGILPINSGQYNDGNAHRAAIHNHKSYEGNRQSNLCRVILDINRATPINLVINDALKTVLGSEGPWTGRGISPATFNKLIIGKDPVAVDSVSTNIIGFNPMANDYSDPYDSSINYLKLATEKGMGEYDLNNIEVIDFITSVERDGEITAPNSFNLHQNYPNPFNPSTTIKYSIPELASVSLSVHNSLGQKVTTLVNQEQVAGSYEVTFDAGNLSSGIYYYTLNSKNFQKTIKMMLLK